MSSITLGGLTFSASSQHIEIDLSEVGHGPIELSYRDAASLERFLAVHRQGESRTGFRVPVNPLSSELDDHLAVTIVHKGIIHDAVAEDLSMTGILVKCPTLDVTPRTVVTVRIILYDDLAKTEAHVVRSEGNMVALHFTNSMEGGEFSPSGQLGQVFGRLQQLYLRKRAEE